MRKLTSRIMSGPYIIWMILFTVIPLGLIVYNGFTNSAGNFTLDNVAAIADPVNANDFRVVIELDVVNKDVTRVFGNIR